MSLSKIRSAFIAGTFLLLCLPYASAQDKLTYKVKYVAADFGRIHVTLTPSKPIPSPLTLVIPRAIPSGYAQQFYDRYVENVKAISSTKTSLKIDRQDGPRWQVGAGQLDVGSIEYQVDLRRLEREIADASDTSKARAGYVGLLGYSVLGYFEGYDNVPIRLELVVPDGWPVFTTLAPKAPAVTSRVTAEAKNFYELADSQIAIGPKLLVQRLEAPLPLFIVVYSETETDVSRHGETVADAFRKVLAYFGDAPFDHYTAFIEILKPLTEQHQYGFSMEHINSSTYFLGLERAITPRSTAEQIEMDRYNFAHHVSHSWIPKRVYGIGYLPFTWELAPQIDTIWFNEGFARFITIEALSESMPEKEAQAFRTRRFEALRKTLDQMPEFIRSMPLQELSRIASSMYSADFRTGRTLFCKGGLMAAEMDQKIRELTKGKKRLRDSLRTLVKWGQQSQRAFRVEELPRLLATPVGVDEREIAEILNRWLTGKEAGLIKRTSTNGSINPN
jgi:predicted metalloprotease with PDZ domain